MVELLTLEVLKKRIDVVLMDMDSWEILVVGGQLDLVTLQVLSNFGDFMIL